jgi:hypothetical protein
MTQGLEHDSSFFGRHRRHKMLCVAEFVAPFAVGLIEPPNDSLTLHHLPTAEEVLDGDEYRCQGQKEQ